MKCPKCQSEMEEGYLYSDGLLWRKGRFGNLKKTFLLKPIKMMFCHGGTLDVIAYRCPKCKKIELYTEETK